MKTLIELKSLAEKATKSDWRWEDIKDGEYIPECTWLNGTSISMGTDGENHNEDGHFIAAANPQTVIALVDEVTKLREVIKTMQDQTEEMYPDDLSDWSTEALAESMERLK